MLLDENVVDLDKLVKEEAYLQEKVKEAYGLLMNSGAAESQQQQ